jgi:1,2-diacylglycerol 3-beta-galactosyltransferase
MDRRLTIVFFDAGGGHRSAAEALKSVLTTPQHPWQVELLNLQELLDQIDILKKITGLRVQDGYNLILRKGWTRLTPQLLPVLQGLIRAYHRPTVKLLNKYWKQHPADLVLSVIPHFNRALVGSVRKTLADAAFATLITDLADYPPHFWIERESEYLICGTEKARQQAIEIGHDRDHVFLASGMILRPQFYREISVDRRAERKRLGLDPDLPTGLVLFGGQGSGTILQIAKNLNASKANLQLILICGKNQKLVKAANALNPRFPMFVEGFTREVHSYMALADFFIGKPGPGSISEALQFHLPVIIECNAATLPQERFNAQWVTEKKFGIVLQHFRNINEGVEQLLDPATFAQLRANAGAYKNRALFEVPEFLEAILRRQHSPPHGGGSPVIGRPALEPAAWATLHHQSVSEST